MTPQEQLCEKMRVEQSAYCLWLTAQPPEEILHHAYEYSVREDIILATEEMNLTPAQVRALLKSPAPLADVYKDFSKLETDYMSIVAQCVEDRADDLLKKEQQQNPPKVYRQSVTYAREHGELQQYHASCHLNERCRDEIDAALAQRFDGMRLGAGAVEQVVADMGWSAQNMCWQRPFKPVMEMVAFRAQIENGQIPFARSKIWIAVDLTVPVTTLTYKRIPAYWTVL